MEETKETNEVKTNEEIGEEKQNVDIGIGTKETVRLGAGMIKIETATVEDVIKEGKRVGDKVVCMCKHPDKEELISISSVKHIVADKVKSVGLWFNKDEDGLIAKNCGLASMLRKVGATCVSELKGKEIETEKDDKDYLCFKAY